MTAFANIDLVLQNFAVRAQPFPGLPVRAALVDFSPSSAQASAWAQDRVFYLFGGSGNILKSTNKSHNEVEPSRYAAFNAEAQAKLRRAVNELERDPEMVLQKTEESLRLMDGFLHSLGRPSLKLYQSHTLYGENGAYPHKARLLDGEDMTSVTRDCLLRHSGELYVGTHVSPCIPYVAMLFLWPDVAASFPPTDVRRTFRVREKPFDKELLLARGTDMRDHVQGTEDYLRYSESLVTELWHEIHTQAMYRLYGGATVSSVGPRYPEDKWDFGSPLEDDAVVLAFQAKEERALRFEQNDGFRIHPMRPLWEMTDLALISTRRMFEEGAFRFLMLDQHAHPLDSSLLRSEWR